MRYQLNDLVFDPQRDEVLLAGSDSVVKISNKASQLLTLLVKQYPAIVDKETLEQIVWNGAPTSDAAISRVVSDLRKGLGDSAKAPNFVKTIPRKGFQLIAQPTVLEDTSERLSNTPLPVKKPLPVKWISAGTLFVFLSVVVFGLIYKTQRVEKSGRIFNITSYDIEKSTINTDDLRQPRYSALLDSLIVVNQSKQILSMSRHLNQTELLYETTDNWLRSAMVSDSHPWLYFQSRSRTDCHYVRVHLKTGQKQKVECPQTSAPTLSFDLKDNLVLTTSNNQQGLAQIIEIDMASGDTTTLFQSDQYDYFNYPRYNKSNGNLLVIGRASKNRQWDLLTIDKQTNTPSLIYSSTRSINQALLLNDDELAYINIESGRAGIYATRLQNNKSELIYNGNIIDLSYDRLRKIFFFVPLWQEAEIKTLDDQGHTLGFIDKSQYTLKFPAVSFDGHHLAYISNKSGKDGLFVINPLKQEKLLTTLGHFNYFQLRWSKDSTRLAYVQSVNRQQKITLAHVVVADGHTAPKAPDIHIPVNNLTAYDLDNHNNIWVFEGDQLRILNGKDLSLIQEFALDFMVADVAITTDRKVVMANGKLHLMQVEDNHIRFSAIDNFDATDASLLYNSDTIYALYRRKLYHVGADSVVKEMVNMADKLPWRTDLSMDDNQRIYFTDSNIYRGVLSKLSFNED